MSRGMSSRFSNSRVGPSLIAKSPIIAFSVVHELLLWITASFKMSSRKDLGLNYAVFSLISKCNVLPFTFDGVKGELKVQRNPWRMSCWRLQLFISFLLHGVYRIVRFVQSLSQDGMFRLQSFCFHMPTTFSATCSLYFQVFLFYGKGLECGELFAELRSWGQGTPKPKDSGGKSLSFKAFMKKYTLFQAIQLTIAPAMVNTALLAFAVYMADYTSPYLLYAVCPQSALAFGISMTIELLALLQLILPYGLVFFQTIYFASELLENVLDPIGNILENARSLSQVRLAISELVKAERASQLFNFVYSEVNYNMKIVTLFVAIFETFVGLQFFSTKPLFSGLNVFIGFESVVSFALLYGLMHRIPESVEAYKRALRVVLKTSPGMIGVRGQVLSKRLEAISPCEIKCGRFCVFDRISVVVFVGYVVTQVSTLLIVTK